MANIFERINALPPRMRYFFIILCLFGSFSAEAQSFLPVIHTNFAQGFSETGQPFVCADLNGDGKIDLAKFAHFDSSIQIYLGDGVGQFSFLQKMNLGTDVGVLSYAIQCGDLNNDGKKDICLKIENGIDSVLVFANDGTAHFTLQAAFSLGSSLYPNGLLISDVNADGKADILCRREFADSMAVLLGDGLFHFTQATMQVSTNNSLGQYVEIGELRNTLNTYNDVITSGDFSIRVLHNDSTGGFTTDSNYSCIYRVNTFSTNDFNNDGYTDIANISSDGSGFSDGLLNVFINDGHNQFSMAHGYSIAKVDAPAYGTLIASADLDGDSNIDIVYKSADTVWLMMGDGSGGFHLAATGIVISSSFQGIRLADVNGDGKMDIVTIGFDALGAHEGINVLLNGISTVQATAIKFGPVAGGDCGLTTLKLWGSSISKKIHIKLQASGKPEIVVNDASISALGKNVVSAQIALDGAMLGVYDMVVTDSFGQDHLLSSAFTVQDCIPAGTTIRIVGPDVTRIRRNTIFYVNVTNYGNNDALMVPVFVFIGGHNTVLFPNGVTGSNGTNTQPVSTPLTNYFGDDGPSKAYSLLLDKIPPDESVYIPVQINPEIAHEPFPVTGSTSPPLQHQPLQENPDGSRSFSKEDQKCINAIMDADLELAGLALSSVPGVDCAKDVVKLYRDYGSSAATKQVQSWDFLGDAGQGLVTCALPFIPGFTIAKAVYNAYQVLDKINNGVSPLKECTKCQINPFCNKNTKITEGQEANDPNTKYSSGYGARHWVPNGETISYGISFENADTADLAAQEVLVVDTLDITKYDMSTFRSNLLQIGNMAIALGYKRQVNDTEYTDLRPDIDLMLRTIVNLDQTTGILRILMTSVDPTTLQLTPDPLLGFLPPDTLKPNGEGTFYYSIKLKIDLPHETEVKNLASIIFDTNDPILTPVCINTVDTVRPVSVMDKLPAAYNDTVIYLSWTGTDKGSGVQKYALYYSENNGPFTMVDAALFGTKAVFPGKMDAYYQFYVEAIDNVNNREVKHAAEVSTRVVRTPIQIFPNPTREVVHVILPSTEIISSITLYSLSDQKLTSSYILNSDNKATVQLPADLITGLYVLRIATQNKIYHAKVNVQY